MQDEPLIYRREFIWTFLLLLAVFVGVLSLNARNLSDQAQFNVDAVSRFLDSYRTLNNRSVESFSELPDFELVSHQVGLLVKAGDIKRGMFRGYIYDYEYQGDGKYVLSASPAGFLVPPVEFGITEAGELKRNFSSVDAQPDTREEMGDWELLPRAPELRSAVMPDYIKN